MENVTETLEVMQEVFNIGDRTLIYDNTLINIEQAELAREVIEFKEQSRQGNAKDFNQLLRSKATDWLIMTASFLMLEKKGDTMIEFSREHALNEVEPLIKKMPAKEFERLKGCVINFFSGSQLNSLILQMSSSEAKSNDGGMLSMQLMKTLMEMSVGKYLSDRNI